MKITKSTRLRRSECKTSSKFYTLDVRKSSPLSSYKYLGQKLSHHLNLAEETSMSRRGKVNQLKMHLLGFLLVALAAVSCCQAEPKCDYNEGEKTVEIICADLVDLSPLTAALASTEKQLNKLTISNSRLTLKREDIDTPRLLDIARLDLSDNGWTSFNSEPIQVLTNMEYLLLSQNNLTEITANMLAGLTGLTRLRLDSNQIETINPAAFYSLTKLTNLDLNYNRIYTIPPGLFSGLPLETIELRGNLLTTINKETFEGVTNLTHLALSGNQIGTIDPAAFQSLTTLTDLDLDSNRISTIPPGLFSGLPLETIELRKNLLTSIDEDSFTGTAKLTNLGLGNNKIRTIDFRAFQNLLNLDLLELNNNDLESFDSRLLENIQLIALDLKGNNLENLANFPLKSTSLLGLRLDECNITSIPEDYFKNVPNLYVLRLVDNHINTLQPGLLSPLTNLATLGLERNALTSFNVDSFEQIHALLISPERTALAPLNRIFPGRTSRKPIVHLEDNPWDCSSPDMIELKAWCEQHSVDFDQVFTCNTA